MNPFREMYLQELSAKQKKIDKNKNNKIDGEDLAHLRKEEAEELDELSKDTLDRYREKAFADQPSTRSDNPAKYDKRKAGRASAFDKVLGRKPVKEEAIEEKLTVGGGAPVKGPNGVVSNTPPKKKPFVNPFEPKKPAQDNTAMGRLRSRMDSARKSVKEAADVLEGRSDSLIQTTAANADENAKHIFKLRDDHGIYAQQGAGASHHILVPREHEDKARKVLAGHLKEETVDEAMTRQDRERAANEAERRAAAIANNPRIAAEVERRKKAKAAEVAKKKPTYALGSYNVKEETDVLEGAVPDHMKGKQKPYVSSDGKGNYEVLGNTGQTKATFSRKEHGQDAHKKAQSHLRTKYNEYMKEETELQEANHREFASQGKMHPDMAKHMKTGEHMDYYEPKTGDKVHGKVMKNDGKEVHVKQTHDSYDPKKKGAVHKFTVSTKLDEKKEDVPFDGPYTKVTGNTKDKSGAVHTPMSRAKHLAQQAAIAIAKKKVKEEFDMDITTEQALELLEAVKKQDIPAFLRKARGDKPLNLDDLKKNDSLSDKNNLAKARGVKEEVEEIEEVKKATGGLKDACWSGYTAVGMKMKNGKKVPNCVPEEVQIDELSKSTIGSYVKKAKSSLIGSSQVMGMGSKTTGQKTHDKAEKKVQKRASGINKAVDRLTKEETMEMNSFKSYMQEDLDEALWPGTPEYKKKFGADRGAVGTSSKTAKGTQTVTKTGVKHERDYEASEKDDKPESGEKRGRGRPKGAASGARQKGSAAKADDRYDSTGFKLHLPNKNR